MPEADSDSGLAEDGRMEALRNTGLSAAADPGMDRFARLVTSVLGVPVALVSLVEPGRQVFPGMTGLAEPWASARETPLTHSLCRHVVLSGEPLIVRDAREDALTCASPAIEDLGVVGYAGMPLTDVDGHVLGSLCAIDTVPHAWTDRELRDLADLAAACSAELRLRIVSWHTELARAEARAALGRSELLLRAAGELADTTGLAQVRRCVRELVTSDLKPAYVGLVLVEDGRLRRLADGSDVIALERDFAVYDLDDAWPSARAARDNTTLLVHGPDGLREGGYSPDAVIELERQGLHTTVCVPLPGPRAPLGTLIIGWSTRHELDLHERAVVTALAGYTARAVERALFVDDRVTVARRLQEAMLTDLPAVAGLELAALYRPAAYHALVGGDWYDAYPLPTGRGELAVSIGDIVGHDTTAATLMGQWRSMLRQADLDHPGAGPAAVVAALEHANDALGIDAAGTLVHAHVRPAPAGGWELSWTTAGHPRPLLRDRQGSVRELAGADRMILAGLTPRPRTTHRTELPPGTLLLLYTDGLIDQPGRDADAGAAELHRLLAARGTEPLPELLAGIANDLAGPAPDDDIALLALRVPGS